MYVGLPMNNELVFKFGESVRTEEDWIKAGPTRMFRLNAEVWAADKENAAAVALKEGGVMVYYLKDNRLDSVYFPHSMVVQSAVETENNQYK